mgnify:CR=1 FL=1
MPGLRNFLPDLKPYIINKEKNGKSASVNLYGEIVESVPTDWWTGEKIDGLFIELSGFLSELETLSEMDEVSFYINSVGGDVNAGMSIFSKIRSLKAKTTTVVDGLAASAAAIVAQAGDTRKVSVGSQTMIHTASAGLIGYYNRQELKKVDNMLKNTDKSLAELLSDRTGRDQDKILEMLTKTTWMTADEAVEEGFADEVINKSEPVVDRVNDSMTYIINGIPHSFGRIAPPSFKTVGVFAPAQMKKVSNGSEPVDIDKNPLRKETEKAMDKKELMEAYPDLINDIVDDARTAAQTDMESAVRDAVSEAVKEERERIKEIDSIAHTIGAELVNEAKYGDNPMTAKDLAFEAMKNQQAKGAEYIKDRTAEQEESGVNNVTVVPVSGSEEDTETKDIEDGANLLKARVNK